MRYFFDLKQSIIRLLSARLRHAQRIEWLYALLFPLEDLYARFMSFVGFINYRTAITGQVIYLEHLLNDTYDPIDRRITITDGEFEPQTYAYFEAEGVREPYIYFASEVDPQEDYITPYSNSLNRVDFYINFPILIFLFLQDLEAYVNPYKLAGKTYEARRLGGL